MKSTLRTSAAFGLAAIVMFSSVSPTLAVSKKEAALSQAPGQVKKIAQQSSPLQVISVAEVPTQASQIAQAKLTEVQSNLTEPKTNQSESNSASTHTNRQNSHQQALLGSNGTVKVGDYVLGGGPDGNPGNKPHLPCKFQIEAYGFDAGVKKVSYVVSTQAPTKPKFEVVVSGSFNLDKDSNSFGASDRGYDGKVQLDLSEALKKYSIHEQQGYHLKVEVTFDGQPSQAGKHKVFWVEKCSVDEQGGGTTSPTPTPTPGSTQGVDDNGQVSSIKTDKLSTGVMGTSIERGNALPYTGGFGLALAQAFGLFLLLLGGIAAHVRGLQAKIAAQMSI